MGSVLAYERILLLDGIYSQIDKLANWPTGLGSFLKAQSSALDSCIVNISEKIKKDFYTYDRQALAEVIMERREDYWQSLYIFRF